MIDTIAPIHDGSHHAASVAAEERDVGNGRVRPMRASISAQGLARLPVCHPERAGQSAVLGRKTEPRRRNRLPATMTSTPGLAEELVPPRRETRKVPHA